MTERLDFATRMISGTASEDPVLLIITELARTFTSVPDEV